MGFIRLTQCLRGSHGSGLSTPGKARRGLYAGKQIMTGHSISHSNRRTNRRWLPNVHKKTYYSDLLDASFKIPVTTRAMRTIDKYGGLDNYILQSKEKRLQDSDFAMNLRKALEERYIEVHGSHPRDPGDKYSNSERPPIRVSLAVLAKE
mmetsp:Transcript_13445/g.53426  ORF Transcript_13445/g.53426 Transcript_13445/m.53426 type:complete len:150 (-) Transcript_13445:30-479(-)